MKNWKEAKGAMNKHYCKTCATMDNVHEYHWQGGTICLCDDCLRDFWHDFVDASDVMKSNEAIQAQDYNSTRT